jgi:hypothetical protein
MKHAAITLVLPGNYLEDRAYKTPSVPTTKKHKGDRQYIAFDDQHQEIIFPWTVSSLQRRPGADPKRGTDSGRCKDSMGRSPGG